MRDAIPWFKAVFGAEEYVEESERFSTVTKRRFRMPTAPALR